MIDALHQVSGLEPLEQIARDFRVDIIGRGRMVRRLYTASLFDPEGTVPDLFDATPFTTPIDLIHSGASEDTRSIYQAIHRQIPFAECFSWRLTSLENDRAVRQEWESRAFLPVNDVTLSTSDGFADRSGAREDILDRRYRFAPTTA